MQAIATSQASPEVPINENFETLSAVAVYGKRQPSTSGLTWGYYGGRWGGFSVADGTVTLTDASANYLVVNRSTGALTSSTSDTNWNNAASYARAYKLTTASSAVSATEDHRAGPGGALGASSVAGSITMSTARILGRTTGGSGSVEELSVGTGLLLDSGVLRSSVTKQTVASAATVTPTFSDDFVIITAQAVALALANPSGTAVDGWGIVIRIKDNGTARAISYDTQYRAIGVTLPTTTVLSKTLYLACIWNAADTKFDVLAVRQEA